MPYLNIRRTLVALFLVIAAFAAIFMIGARGIGKKVGAPGVDKLVSRGLERIGVSEGTGSEPQTWNIREIAGTWTGLSDVDGTTWKFTFEDDRAVRVSSSSGYYLDGTAFVHRNLGLTDGNLRVPPGWNILDVDTINSSERSHRNTISLGAYSVHEDLLKYCFSEPGKLVRPVTDLSGEGVQCFELTKGLNAVERPSGRTAPGAVANDPLPSRSEPRRDALSTVMTPSSVSGQAAVVIDGSQETWPLRTDRDSVTDLKDPHRLTLQFQAGGVDSSLARRIELTFDAARTGRHTADGFAYLENLFIREKVPVGSEKSGVPQAVFLYIAGGGRIFPPRLACDIRVTSAYNGGMDIQLDGKIDGCTVFSAGEQIQIGPVSFSVTGHVIED